MQYKCLIAEDDLLQRDLLHMLLGKIEQADVVAVCEDGLAAMQYLLNHEVHIVFSDVDMPELSGINLLRSLKHPPVFVFISSFPEYAAEGFDLDVVDFIVKPVTPQRLFKAFSKAKDHIDLRAGAPATSLPQGNTDAIFARTGQGLQKLIIADITYAESKANFSMIHLLDGSSHLVLVNLKGLASQLPDTQFVRIHKNFLINWNLVTTINKDDISVAGTQVLPIGSTYRKTVLGLLAQSKVLERRPVSGDPQQDQLPR